MDTTTSRMDGCIQVPSITLWNLILVWYLIWYLIYIIIL